MVRSIIATSLLLTFVAAASAAPITEQERKACRDDYKANCSEYGLDSPALRMCMDKHGRNLSRGCVDALIDAGEISRAEVNRRRKNAH